MLLYASFKKSTSSYRAFGMLLSAFFLQGCASTHKPEELLTPTSVTCIYLQAPISFHVTRGLFGLNTETRLERGPYISEREDAEGTYYRAPPGGFSGWPYSFQSADVNNARDGGFWIPHDPKKTPRLYSYGSTSAVQSSVPPDNINCSSFTQIKTPETTKINLISMATGGAVGGAIGGATARSMNSQSSMSYGQSAGVGAAGGAIGMLIVGAIINADVGKIILYPWPKNSEIYRLRKFADQAVIVKELPTNTEQTAMPESANATQ